MNRDKFYDAFMATAPPPPAAPADAEALEAKDTYTRAEVEELINRKLEELKEGGFDNGSKGEEGNTEGNSEGDENNGEE